MRDQVEYNEHFVLVARLTLLGLDETVRIVGNGKDYRFYVYDGLLHYIDKMTLYDTSWNYYTLRSVIGVLE